MQGYQLSLSSLLAVMQGMSGSHRFRTEVPPRTIGKDAYVVEILIQEGKFIACEIKTAQGSPIFQQDRDVSMVKEMGELNWSLISFPQQAIQKPMSPTTRSTPVRLTGGTIPTNKFSRR